MKEHSAEKDVPERCGEHFARHSSQPHLVAVCTLPKGHDGLHDNLLSKRILPPAKSGAGQ